MRRPVCRSARVRRKLRKERGTGVRRCDVFEVRQLKDAGSDQDDREEHENENVAETGGLEEGEENEPPPMTPEERCDAGDDESRNDFRGREGYGVERPQFERSLDRRGSQRARLASARAASATVPAAATSSAVDGAAGQRVQ